MRQLLIDISPLRESRPFRRLWLSSMIAGLGGQMSLFAVTLQTFTISHSSIAVGALGVFVAVPSIVFAMFGGILADKFDRRKLVIIVMLCQLVVAGGFWAQSTASLDKLWIIYALVAVQSTLGAIAVPARRACLRRLLPAASMPAALALTLLSIHGVQVIGPVFGGLVVAKFGLETCFAFQMVGFCTAIWAALGLPKMPSDDASPRLGFAAVAEALRFVWQTATLRGAFLADLSMTVLGVPVALFPAINSERFGGLPQTLGLLAGAVAIGGVVGTVFTGPLSRVARKGRALLCICAVWGLLIIGFGLSADLWSVLICLSLCGVADALAVTLGQTIVQNNTPDELRGRISAAEHIIQMGGPQLGGARAGLVGSWGGATFGIVSGGISTIVAVSILFIAVPALSKSTDPQTQ